MDDRSGCNKQDGYCKDRYAAALKLFTSAHKSFQDIIPKEEHSAFADFKDSDSLMKNLRAQIDESPTQTRLHSCCRKIDSFAKRWEPFFGITDIFVSSHPDIAALAWGSVRLVFKLCGHYVAFFQKLADMFECISSKLPYFARDLHIFNERKKRQPNIERHSNIVHPLACMFECIIQFCKEACHVFAKKRMVVFGRGPTIELLWKPFDAKFSDVISRLERYTELYQLELSLAHREELMGHYEAFDKFLLEVKRNEECRQSQHREEEIRLLREKNRCIGTWINAPDYMATFEQKRVLDVSGKRS
ncbi:hypothetical protein F4806DRAFT_52648 [Annulohypoxylon nitens]|nr:hypothetical protein F4806DRAFT_52648 [Annulohypoxylon nitens]